jgi:hypothetical protein
MSIRWVADAEEEIMEQVVDLLSSFRSKEKPTSLMQEAPFLLSRIYPHYH